MKAKPALSRWLAVAPALLVTSCGPMGLQRQDQLAWTVKEGLGSTSPSLLRAVTEMIEGNAQFVDCASKTASTDPMDRPAATRSCVITAASVPFCSKTFRDSLGSLRYSAAHGRVFNNPQLVLSQVTASCPTTSGYRHQSLFTGMANRANHIDLPVQTSQITADSYLTYLCRGINFNEIALRRGWEERMCSTLSEE
jgi:hypothetical protein